LLQESEDNFNVSLKNVQYTSPEGKQSKLDEVYLRGSQVTMMILPSVLARAPMFTRIKRFKEEKWVPAGGGAERPVR
jgi:small nuclear ribonucleoprotein D3